MKWQPARSNIFAYCTVLVIYKKVLVIPPALRSGEKTLEPQVILLAFTFQNVDKLEFPERASCTGSIRLKLVENSQRSNNSFICCNLSVGVALNVRFTTNGMCANKQL